MIDTLISGEDKQKLPKELTDQRDGKLVDHMFIGQGLIEQSNLPAELTYYIGDSKYYKRSKDDTTVLGDKSIYKQYTYAKNVVQWNMNLFLDDNDDGEQPQLRDSLTEGYNPIPNFFISARIPNKKEGKKFLSFDEAQLETQANRIQFNRQFENRLFDRDTLLLCHYDVNFLYIVSLYGRANKSKQAAWREYVRKEFREKIQDTFNQLYTFRTIQPRDGMDCYRFLKENFSQLNGKLYRSKANKNYLVLALMKCDDNSKSIWNSLNVRQASIEQEMTDNEAVLKNIRSHFYVSEPFALDTELQVEDLPNVGTLAPLPKGADDLVMIAVAGSEEKRQWTFDNLWYNIPLDKIADSPWNQAKYLLLYVKGEKFAGNLCKIVRTKHDVWTKEKLVEGNYPDAPSHSAYFMIRIRKPSDTDVELQKLQFNVKGIPNKYWGNERMAFMLVKLNSLENVIDNPLAELI